MVQSEKMLSLGGLSAGMAHEINNPLAGMMQNAQAMKEQGGEKEPQFTLLLKRESGSIRIEITNTGSGINHEVQQCIFEPFFTTKSEGVGTGLGLSVSYFIITEIHNGEMQVESDGENWVKFIIHLPI